MLSKSLLVPLVFLFFNAPLQAGKLHLLTFGGDFYSPHRPKQHDFVAEYAEKTHRQLVDKYNGKLSFGINHRTVGKAATTTNLLRDIKRIANTAKKDDFAIVYITCHGLYDIHGEYHVLLTNTYMHCDAFLDKLSLIKCPTFLILETCYAGLVSNHLNNKHKNICVLCSSLADEASYMTTMYTSIKKALQYGDTDKDGRLTLAEFCAHITKNTKKQQPIVVTGCMHDMVLVRQRKKRITYPSSRILPSHGFPRGYRFHPFF